MEQPIFLPDADAFYDGDLYDESQNPHVTPQEPLELTERDKRAIDVYQSLERGVEAVKSSQGYREYLTAMSRFHQYSFGNIMLIHTQRPDATRVASYARWQSMGRQVQRGEKGIKILVPYKRMVEDEETGERRQIVTGFGIGHVYDIAQTTGTPLPEYPIQELTGSDPLGDELFSRINDIITDRVGVGWDRKPLPGHRRGSWSPDKRHITIRSGLYPDQEVKTFMHEAVHAFRNDQPDDKNLPGDPRSSIEQIAESTAFVVLNKFGMDTSSYTFPYVASWTKDTDALRQNLQAIQETSNDLIAMIAGGVEPSEEGGR